MSVFARCALANRDNQIEILAGLDSGEMVALDPVRAAIALKQNGGVNPMSDQMGISGES